ncbi:MAG: hypothetical protein LC731_03015, partial [Acidobacteria bacterium]|nr:hypothetical protein [Acidobacteriota bacterium]
MNRPVNMSTIKAAHKHRPILQAARRLLLGAITIAVFAFICLFISRGVSDAPSSESAAQTTEQAREAYGQLPLSFEANRGQAKEDVNFVARGAGYTLALSPAEANFVLARRSNESSQSGESSQAVLRMNLVGANQSAAVEGLNELEGKVNYFIGDDPTKWRANIPTFGRVRYNGVYPGIDVVYYGNQRHLEYDFVVAPGSDARAIALRFKGADKVEVDAVGDLLLTLGESVIRQPKPVVYQEVAGERRAVEGSYAVAADGRVGFALGRYDQSLP